MTGADKMAETKEIEEFEKVLNDFYPDLKGKKIQLDEGFTQFGFGAIFFPIINSLCVGKHGENYDIGYLSDAFRYPLGELYVPGFRGFLAHELSHVALGNINYNKEPNTKFQKILESLCDIFAVVYCPWAAKEEIATDENVIRRGLGKDLLAAKRMLNSPHGYSARKLEKILNRQELNQEEN